MPRGQPDYNVPEYTFFSVETPNSDLFAERLGFSRLDNRGRILWMDDFRQGLAKWHLESDAGGGNPVHIFLTPFMLGNHGSVKLDPVVNGGVSDLYSQFVLPVSKRLGVEVGLYLPSNFGRVEINLQHIFSGTTAKAISLFVNNQTGEVFISHASGSYSIVTPASIGYFINRWVSIKIVGDFESGKYHRLMLGNTEYDLSSYNLVSAGNGFIGNTLVQVTIEGRTAVYKEAGYLGYVIISGDEP